MDLPSSCPTPNCRAPALVISMVAVGCLIALTLWGQYGHRLFALDLAAGLASWALLPLMARRPGVATIMADILAALSPAATPAATVGTLRTAQVHRFRVAVAIGMAGVLAHAVRGLWQPISGLPFGWWLVLVIIAHAGLVGWGALSRARTALIESLRERADRAEAEQGRRVAEARALERTRIAREMHDVLAHRLSLVATYAGALEYRPDAPAEQLSRAAGVIRSGVHEALSELRDVLNVLREGGEQDCGDGPQPVLADLAGLLEEARAAGTPIELDGEGLLSAWLPPTLSRTAYRVVQEGLTNARKHAPGQSVRVSLGGRPGDRLTIDMRNAVGRTVQGTAMSIPGSGTGLIGLSERVRLAGGVLDHRDGAEFVLSAWLPFPTCPP